MLIDLDSQSIQQHIAEAEFGLERESLRVRADGTLAQSKHPFGFHRNIDRDFCENQTEIIGDVFTDPEGLNAQLCQLQDEIDAVLSKNNELLWPFSNPPKISGEEEIPVAEFVGSQRGKSEYRQYLAANTARNRCFFRGSTSTSLFRRRFFTPPSPKARRRILFPFATTCTCASPSD